VKKTLLILPILVFRVVLLTGLLLAGAVASRGHVAALENLVALVFLPGLMLGVIVTYLRAITDRVIPITLVPMTLLVSAAFLVAGILVGFPEASKPVANPEPVEWTAAILHGRSTSIYVDRQVGFEFRDTVLIRHGMLPRLHHHPVTYWNYEDGVLVIPGEGTVSTAEISGLQQTRGPSSLTLLVDDLRTVLRLLPPEIRPTTLLASPGYIATLLVLSGLIALTWPLVRLTRWPLMNGVITLGWARLLPAIPRLWDSAAPLMPNWFTSTFGLLSSFLTPAPPAVLLWLVLAIALLVLWVFQPSLARPRREMDEVEEQP
jgi:hypothetical protein